jgi:hypothetical protein
MVKRVLVIILGALLLLGGIALAVAGGALMFLFGSDDTLSTGQQSLATPTTALVASIDDIQDTKSFADAVGLPTLRLNATGSGHDLFIGIGPAGDVDRYLAGSRIDQVTDLEVDPFRLKTVTRDGSATPAAPGAQTFWTARSNGAAPTLDWKIKDGSYRLVLMNADASPGVQTTGKVELKIPHLFSIGIGVLAGGIILAIIGLVLLIVGARMRGDRKPAPASNWPPGDSQAYRR